jgi:hypothetical protein
MFYTAESSRARQLPCAEGVPGASEMIDCSAERNCDQWQRLNAVEPKPTDEVVVALAPIIVVIGGFRLLNAGRNPNRQTHWA